MFTCTFIPSDTPPPPFSRDQAVARPGIYAQSSAPSVPLLASDDEGNVFEITPRDGAPGQFDVDQVSADHFPAEMQFVAVRGELQISETIRG